MSDVSKEERIVRKAVLEAETGLKALEKDLKSAIKQFENGTLTPAKSKAAGAKILAFMKKQAPVTKLQNAPFFGDLPQEVQGDVVWLDGVVNGLNTALGYLSGALKATQKKPDKDAKALVKTARELETYISVPPKGVAMLLKEAKKGLADGQPMLSMLPMALLMWMIIDTILRGWKSRK